MDKLTNKLLTALYQSGCARAPEENSTTQFDNEVYVFKHEEWYLNRAGNSSPDLKPKKSFNEEMVEMADHMIKFHEQNNFKGNDMERTIKMSLETAQKLWKEAIKNLEKDMLFDKRLFVDSLTRDDMNAFEDAMDNQ